MLDRDTLRLVLDRFLAGEISQHEVSNWAYEMITQYGEMGDQLVSEVLFNLVSFHDSGPAFEHHRPSREKLQYFMNWLEGVGNCGWDQYNAIFDPGKLM